MEILEIKNRSISLKYSLENGNFSIFQDEKIIIENAFNEIILGKDKYSSLSADKIQGDIIENTLYIKQVYPDIEISLHFLIDDDFVQIRSSVKNISNSKIILDSFSPVIINKIYLFEDGIKECFFYKHGYQSWSPSLSVKTTSRDLVPKEILPTVPLLKRMHLALPHKKTVRKPGFLISDGMTVLYSGTDNFFLIGFLSSKLFFSQIRLEVEDFEKDRYKLYAICEMERYLLNSGEEIILEPLVINFCGDKFLSLQKYAQMVGKEMSAVFWEKPPVGWCSWYWYFNKITEEEILKNLKILKDIKEELPLSFVQVDDGYQKDIGDWLKTNNKFPSGMKYIAEKIKESGFLPGIWIAPFIVRSSSLIFKEHFAWILKDENGSPVLAGINPLWGGKYYALDLTHPEVEKHLEEVFKTVVHNWGFKFLKLDFIFAGALPGVHWRENTTRIQAYRHGLQIIREAVGDDVFILGCGAPIFPSVGLVNGMRISGDVDPSWVHWSGKIIGDDWTISCRNAIRNTITRYFTHNTFWINDPDCIMVRGDRTKLNEEEVKTLVSVAGLSGGIFLSSDNFTTLDRTRLRYLQHCFPSPTSTIIPLDIFSTTFPSYLLYEFEKGKIKWSVLNIINWGKREMSFEVLSKYFKIEDGEKYYLYSFWKKEVLELKNKINIKIPSHGCELLRLIPVENTPCVVPTFSLSCGEEMEECYFSYDLNQLYFRIKIPHTMQGDIIVVLPENLTFENFTSTCPAEIKIKENIIFFSSKINKEATFTLNFRKKV